MESIEIISVNISEKKGTAKKEIPCGELTLYGLKDDAHAGEWGRQVSFLDISSIEKISEETGRSYEHGDFGENITTSGLDFSVVKPGDHLYSNRVELEITQIGKSCHGDGCTIFRNSGKCAMPKEGIFAKVIHPGIIKKGDILKLCSQRLTLAVVTLSSRAYQGVYPDKSGPMVQALLNEYLYNDNKEGKIEYLLLPDNATMLKKTMEELIIRNFDVIVTTGGTGIGPQDITPDVIKPLLEKELPGIMEFIRNKYGSVNRGALLSRSCAGIAGNSLIFCLPGSVKAVTEYMGEIIPLLPHLYRMKRGGDKH
ncbi:MAG: molybdopterin-binding protein [Bacteroidales bacterium]|nr:molybdopterin-binding protein [Bacteroidales bacterium]MDD3989251.1 molybdopterin-binding protein [Bacteroidales bacterium]MDD4639656.1 molybdopterin-binding protein [Bacteroidales bacterium]